MICQVLFLSEYNRRGSGSDEPDGGPILAGTAYLFMKIFKRITEHNY